MKTQIIKLKIIYNEHTENAPSIWDWATILDLPNHENVEILEVEDEN